MTSLDKVDKEAVSKIALEMGAHFQQMVDLFPKEMSSAKVLKNLAASSIHFSMFMKEFYESIEGKADNELYDKMAQKFLDNCGCKNE